MTSPPNPEVHVVPDTDDNGDLRWRIVLANHYLTQEAAVAIARPIADHLGSELVTHAPDGTIVDKDSHGNDPPNIPG